VLEVAASLGLRWQRRWGGSVVGVAASLGPGLRWWRHCGQRRQQRRGDGHGDGGGEKERDDVAAFEPVLLDLGSGRPRREWYLPLL
jgi:hypothetical protein